MGDRTCLLPGCNRPARTRGLCHTDYEYRRRHGEITKLKRPTVEERFWAKVDKNTEHGCWIWTGSRNELGYGCFRASTHHLVKAHRFAYQLLVGPISDELVLDHRCMRTSCVNPDHLEPVTQAENIDRGYSTYVLGKWQATRTSCPSGHPYAGANLYVTPRGERHCRTCKNTRQRQARAALKRRVVVHDDRTELPPEGPDATA